MGIISQARQVAKISLQSFEELYKGDGMIEDGRYKRMDYNTLVKFYEAFPGYKETMPYSENAGVWGPIPTETIGSIPESQVGPNTPPVSWGNKTSTIGSIDWWIKWLKENKVKYISWLAYVHMTRSTGYDYFVTSDGMIRVRNTDTIGGDRVDVIESYYKNEYNYKLLDALANGIIEKVHYKWAITQYNSILEEMESSRQRLIRLAGEATNTGITKLFEQKPKTDPDKRKIIYAQMEELQAQLVNGLACRTWGFEIEVPDAKGVETQPGIEKGDDGSLRSENNEDCECDCEECAYHSCNCDICEYGSEDPSHCGDSYCASADSAEFRTVGGIQRVKHAGMYKLLEDLNNADAEMNDSAGTHIHVYAQDLTTHQVGQVMASYTWVQDIISVVAGRRNVNYARDLRLDEIGNALRNRNPRLRPDKPVAVNITWIANQSERGTIEFRQMDCNLNADRISFWAWMMRGFVETAKRGATMQSFRDVTDLVGIIEVFAKFNFFLDSETPGMLIPGSKLDKDKVQKAKHLVNM